MPELVLVLYKLGQGYALWMLIYLKYMNVAIQVKLEHLPVCGDDVIYVFASIMCDTCAA